MTGRRGFRTLRLTGLVIAGLALAPASALADARGSGVIEGSGTTYTLTITNVGDQPIRCFRFTSAEGVRVTSVSPSPPVVLLPPAQSPPNRSVFGGEVNVPPGGDLVVQFTTEAPYPENGGGTLDVSSTCAQGSDVTTAVTGPVFACRCLGVTASLTKFSFATPRELDFKVTWKLGCSQGSGTGCKGRIRFETRQPGHKFTKKSEQTVECAGPCAQTTTKTVPADGRKNGRTVRTGLNTLLPKGFERDKRGGKSIKLRAKLYCLDGNRERLFKTVTFRINFKKGGAVDGKKSDLNGDGKRDRPPRK